MSTFYKIVLAIASSWNNGTSSPAPQGNRALSNQTTDLAERQEPTSAKTPPPPNPIGKRIGKFWIPILLIAATALTTIPIEQVQAADSPTPVMSPSGPANYDVITRHLLVPAPVQPAAVPVPVVVVAKPVLKKGAIVAGKWLIAVLAEYGVHTALDRVFQNNKDQEANVTVKGARWASNEYFKKISSPNTPPPRNVLTTIATMGGEDDIASAEGWDAINNRSMTQHEAKNYMKRRIAIIKERTWSAIVPATPTKHAQTMFFPVKARQDHYAQKEAQTLALYRANFPGIIFTRGGETIEKWKVGSFVMKSKFVDPAPILKALGTENAIDSEANYYEAEASWEYRELNPNGTWGEWKKRKKTFSQDTGDGIKSWDNHTFTFDFCKDNHDITAPAIYEGIRRFISKRPVYEKTRRSGQARRGGDYYWKRVGWEPVVAQEYQDLN